MGFVFNFYLANKLTIKGIFDLFKQCFTDNRLSRLRCRLYALRGVDNIADDRKIQAFQGCGTDITRNHFA